MVSLTLHRVLLAVLCALAVTSSASNGRLGRLKHRDPKLPPRAVRHAHPGHNTQQRADPYPHPGFTLIIPTYKHVHLLDKLLHHLTHPKPPPSLSQIVVVWLNVGVPLPDVLQPASLARLQRDSGVPVAVRISQRNSKNERFRPLRGWGEPIQTRAVMVMDDDLVLRKETIEWGWHQYASANPHLSRRAPRTGRIVGFQGKDWHHHPHQRAEDEEWEFVGHPEKGVGLVLTSGAWLKTEWLEHYWDEGNEMAELRGYVDKTRDCEDLLFNFLAANLSRTAPLLLQPTHHLRTAAAADLPESEHFLAFTAQVERDATRSHCLAHFFAHFARYAPDTARPGHFPLKRAHASVSQDLGDHSRAMWDDESWEEEDEGDVGTVAMVGSGVARVRGKEGGKGEVHGGNPWGEEEKDEKEGEEKEKEQEDEEDDDDDDDDDEEGPSDYFKEWEALLSDMSDDEVAELMQELAEHHESQPSDEGDHDEEEEHHRDEL